MKRKTSYSIAILAALISAVMALAITVHFDLNKKTEAVTINQTADDPAPEPKVLAEVEPASWLDSRPSSFADLFKEVRSAVVNISTTKIVQGASPFPSLRFGPRGNDPFEDFFDKFFEGVPRDQKRKSLGSGFIIDKEGHVLTNNHVVEGANEIEVHLADERKFKAKIIGTDPETDVAVIKIEGKDIPYVKLGDSDESKVGDWVIAVGNPFGLEHTLTAGIVSAKGRILGGLNKYGQFIQTDASINPGNSGGPLFNMNGEVVGINTAIIAGGQGLGFAIPINTAKILVPQLIKDGKVTNRGWLGVGIQMITDDLAKSFGMTEAQGVLISEVVEKSPADKSGMKRGDIVLTFKGHKIDTPSEFVNYVGTTEPGEETEMEILRGGKKQTLKVKIGQKREEKGVIEGDEDAVKSQHLGVFVREVTAAEAKGMGLRENNKGVMVTRVEPNSPVENVDVRAGDVILEINGEPITSVDEFNKVSSKLKKGSVARVLLRRDESTIYVAFKL